MAGPRRAVAGYPLLLNHWDPGMYPNDPHPLIEELVINLLAHGHVMIKDVDLFMNEDIVSSLSHARHRSTGISNWDLFVSLLQTKRITVLTPDPSRGLDPEAPFSAAAEDHAQRLGHAGKSWTYYTPERQAFCRKLDSVCVGAKVCRQREQPPKRNMFAALLRDILTDEDETWRSRRQFRHISGDNAKLFAEFCAEPAKAISFLVAKPQFNIVNRDQGFYRTRLYQCASLLENPLETSSFENLAQSVYFANETVRERASGSFFGRLAECPNPYIKRPAPKNIKVSVVPVRQPRLLELLATPDLGEVVGEALAEAGPVMHHFWQEVGQSTDPEQEFTRAWTSVTDAFAKASSDHANDRRRLGIHARWEELTSKVECLLLKSELGVLGLRFFLAQYPNEYLRPLLEGAEHAIKALVLTANSIQVVGEHAEHWIRSGLTEASMLPQVRDALVGAATLRASSTPDPIVPKLLDEQASKGLSVHPESWMPVAKIVP